VAQDPSTEASRWLPLVLDRPYVFVGRQSAGEGIGWLAPGSSLRYVTRGIVMVSQLTRPRGPQSPSLMVHRLVQPQYSNGSGDGNDDPAQDMNSTGKAIGKEALKSPTKS
jgi:hypothetical protein